MTIIDFSTLSVAELNDLQKKAELEKESRKVASIERIRELIKAEAESAGVTVEEVVSIWTAGKSGRKQSNQKNKEAIYLYQDPNNPSNKWTGKGRAPAWFTQAMNNGYSKESMKIA